MGTRLSTARGILCVLLSLFFSQDLASQTVGTVALTASDGAPGDAFGRSVAISGDTLVVGANGDDERGENAGAAYVFVRDASGAWRQQQKLLEDAGIAGNYFGWSVDIDADVAVVGAPGDMASSVVPGVQQRGAAYVFLRDATGRWLLNARLQPQELAPGDHFGWRVVVDRDTILVSAPYRPWVFGTFRLDGVGAVWAYRRTTTDWRIEKQWNGEEGLVGWLAAGSFSGRAMALDEAIAVFDDQVAGCNGSGTMHRLVRPADDWLCVNHYPVDPASQRPAWPTGLVDLAPWTGTSVLAATGDGRIDVVGEDQQRTQLLVVPDANAVALATDPEAQTVWAMQKSSIWRMTPSGSEKFTFSTDTLFRDIARGADGRVFVIDGCVVKRLTAEGTLANVAGWPGQCGFSDGPASQARFGFPTSLAVAGNSVLVADESVGLRHVDLSTGIVSTVYRHPSDQRSRVNQVSVGPDGTIWFAEGRYQDGVYLGSSVIYRLPSWVDLPSPEAGGAPFDFPVDGAGSNAAISFLGAMTVRADGVVMFRDQSGYGTLLRTVSNRDVRTVAGSLIPYSPGYATAIRGSRIVVGTPHPPQAGGAWVYEWATLALVEPVPATLIIPANAGPFSRYGTAVALTDRGHVAIGPANGCLWDGRSCLDVARDRPEAGRVDAIRVFTQTGDTWRERAALPVPQGVLLRSGFGSVLDADGPLLVAGAPEWDYRPQDPPPHGDVVGPGRVFVYDLATLDSDGDGMLDDWEERFGLDPTDPADAVLDADADGLTNAQEHTAHSHPHNDEACTRYFAEGATSDFFETEIAIANPESAPATVNLRFLLRTGALASTALTVPALQSRHVSVSTVAGMARAEFSTTVESDNGVVGDRRMTWPRSAPYGAHAETAVSGPATTWYLAEGATHSGFNLFYLLQNPNPAEALVHVRFLRPSGMPLDKSYTLPPASRTNIWVNQEAFSGLGTALASTDVSAVIESLDGLPIIVERAMYRDVAGQVFGAGHAAAGVTAPATEWFLAEGAAGAFLDLFVLIANPGDVAADIEATYLLPDGTTIVAPYRVAANSRFNIWVDDEDARLADTAVFTIIRSTNGVPVIVERALWWPGPTAATWYEAHASAGATTTGPRWAVADGEVDPTRHLETYLLIANTSATAAEVKVTLLFEEGALPVSLAFAVGPHSRFNVPVGHYFPAAAGRRFGAVVESLGDTPAPLVVERTMYWDARGQFWAAGINALATRVP